ncbi:regulator of G-protein signaling 9-binding protein-like [Octodon degus]|uniref:Regulator of G-protein signaling 9-binding protein-like n=1 Tax=Octodon degus TaxID=10160 RepID=A0A6P3FF93_OCTDE|nr:regulator of G-protein signaling 9-binding protein-like [Octodon degus]
MQRQPGPREPEDAATAESRAALDALCRFAAGYRHLAMGVGSSADGPRLRLALEEGGRRGLELSQGLHDQLLAELTQLGVKAETRAELERIWVLFVSTLDIFLQDLGRAHRLSQLFPVPAAAAGTQLVSTGVSSQGLKGWSLRLASTKAAQGAGELGQWVQQLAKLQLEMEKEVNVPPWGVEPSMGDLVSEAASLFHHYREEARARCQANPYCRSKG